MTASSYARRVWVEVLEGGSVQQPPPRIVGAPFDGGTPIRAVLGGVDSAFRFDDSLLSKHVLFLGSIGSGKTNAMQHLFHTLRRQRSAGRRVRRLRHQGRLPEGSSEPGDQIITNEQQPQRRPGDLEHLQRPVRGGPGLSDVDEGSPRSPRRSLGTSLPTRATITSSRRRRATYSPRLLEVDVAGCPGQACQIVICACSLEASQAEQLWRS